MILHSQNKTIELGKRTLIMGILNVTTDSFSDGGDYTDIDLAVERAKEMVKEGADIIDVGGMSTRPGHEEISIELELERVIPVIKRISKEVDTIISIDTYRYEVAEEAIKNGAHIINDVWGLQFDNGEMAKVASKYNTVVIAMHNQNGTEYKEDIMLSMRKFFNKTFEIAEKNGLSKDKIIIDPGIGFGKDIKLNLEVLHRMNEIRDIGPILLGASRKRFIGTLLNNLPPKERTEGTIATTIAGIERGADIVRVHDVLQNKRAVLVADAIIRGYKD
ncbi:dihydropteroate synthase [Fusobacterium sp.]|uniref:dihydropteroate synthase n=1 Tax=Fusobacterium sp. TaxID=68766 RepID=UPI002607976B|nr:dihydropteroate synthase [Fusobacterium sp.]